MALTNPSTTETGDTYGIDEDAESLDLSAHALRKPHDRDLRRAVGDVRRRRLVAPIDFAHPKEHP